MKSLRLLIDMDSVLADLLSKWLVVFNADRGSSKELLEAEITSFGFDGVLSARDKKRLFSYLDIPGFFADLPVIPGSQKVLKALKEDGHDVVIVTSPPSMTARAKDVIVDKLTWLHHNFPFLNKADVVFTKRKGLVLGHLLFDDAPHNLIDFNAAGGLTVAMDYAYNRGVPTHYRVLNKNWDDFYELINLNIDYIYDFRRLLDNKTQMV